MTQEEFEKRIALWILRLAKPWRLSENLVVRHSAIARLAVFFTLCVEGCDMIIIYNLPGLLLGLLGLFAGFLAVVITKFISVGLLTVIMIWFWGGRWWKYRSRPVGEVGRYPALFFIPLPYLAVVGGLLSFPIAAVEMLGSRLPSDPRKAQFDTDERLLDSASFTGEVALSQAIHQALKGVTVEEAKADNYHVFSKINPDAVLILVKSPNLKNFKDSARDELLRFINLLAEDHPETKGKRVFIGIKGRFALGSSLTPSGGLKTGPLVPETDFYDFYGPPPQTPQPPKG